MAERNRDKTSIGESSSGPLSRARLSARRRFLLLAVRILCSSAKLKLTADRRHVDHLLSSKALHCKFSRADKNLTLCCVTHNRAQAANPESIVLCPLALSASWCAHGGWNGIAACKLQASQSDAALRQQRISIAILARFRCALLLIAGPPRAQLSHQVIPET